MGGEFGEPKQRDTDWNFACDPVAAATACRLFTGPHVHVGLNVTFRCRLPAAEAKCRFKGPLLDLVLRMADSWFERHDSIIFHDPLAAAIVFEPELCSFDRGQVDVDEQTGRTQFTPSPEGSDEVAADVDPQRFLEHFFQVAAE
jgi:inosine-uridine nucleoside N-ribohydrolase